jgi:hypothetical protein
MAIEKLIPDGAPWSRSKLFFRADAPGQAELRAAMRWAVEHLGLAPNAAMALTWAWLVEVHDGDDQGE